MSASVAALPPISQLYLQHRTRALAIARRIVGDVDEAEDVVQDVFTRLARKPEGFTGRAAWTTWLHRVMVNSSINWLRARKRRDGRPSSGGRFAFRGTEAARSAGFRPFRNPRRLIAVSAAPA